MATPAAASARAGRTSARCRENPRPQTVTTRPTSTAVAIAGRVPTIRAIPATSPTTRSARRPWVGATIETSASVVRA